MRQDQRGLDLAAKSLRRRWWWRLSWLETFERSLEIFEADLDRLLGERSKAAVLAYFEFGSVHCSLFLLEPFRFHGIIESSPRGFLAFIGDRETDRAPAPSRGTARHAAPTLRVPYVRREIERGESWTPSETGMCKARSAT
jgi:hypothetical protein